MWQELLVGILGTNLEHDMRLQCWFSVETWWIAELLGNFLNIDPQLMILVIWLEHAWTSKKLFHKIFPWPLTFEQIRLTLYFSWKFPHTTNIKASYPRYKWRCQLANATLWNAESPQFALFAIFSPFRWANGSGLFHPDQCSRLASALLQIQCPPDILCLPDNICPMSPCSWLPKVLWVAVWIQMFLSVWKNIARLRLFQFFARYSKNRQCSRFMWIRLWNVFQVYWSKKSCSPEPHFTPSLQKRACPQSRRAGWPSAGVTGPASRGATARRAAWSTSVLPWRPGSPPPWARRLKTSWSHRDMEGTLNPVRLFRSF